MTTTTTYEERLAELCADIGARPHHGWDGPCPRRLHNRRHRCSHNPRPGEALDMLGACDHHVWLRWPDGCWALLAQPYGLHDLDSLLARGLLVSNLGPAPWGPGTTALLVLGADASPMAPGP